MLRAFFQIGRVLYTLDGLRRAFTSIGLTAVIVLPAAGNLLPGAEPTPKAESHPSRAQPPTGPFARPTASAPPLQDYVIQPGDMLDIEVYDGTSAPPTHGKFLVQPSGQVALGVLYGSYGRVGVRGLDLMQAQEEIQKRLAKVLRVPQVQVTLDIATWRSRELELERNVLQARLQELRKKIVGACGLSPENVATVLQGLERDRFALEIESNVKESRRKKLAAIIAELRSRAEGNLRSDEVSEHLKKIIESRRAILSIALARRASAASGGPEEVKKAQADLAEAEIRPALRKEELAKSQADGGIERLSQQLQEVSTDLVQDATRLVMLGERRDRINAARESLDEYTRIVEYELPSVNRTLERARWARGGLAVSPSHQ